MAWSAAYFFFLMSGYYVLRPVRDEMGIVGGVKNLSWMFTGTLVAVALSNPLLAWLVSRYSRRRFIPLVYRFFQLNLLVFFALFAMSPAQLPVWPARAFFIWVSVFNMFAVSVFWGFMADLFNSEQGKRLYGFIGAGGTLGAACGAGLTHAFVVEIGTVRLLLISLVLIELAVQCVTCLGGIFGDDGACGRFDVAHPAPLVVDPTAARADDSEPIVLRYASGAVRSDSLADGGVWRALARVFVSPYLLMICLCLVIYTFTSTFVYFEQARIVSKAFSNSDVRTAYFARIDLYINVLTLILQALATSRIIAAIDVGWAQAVVPFVTVIGCLVLWRDPTPGVVLWFQVLRNTSNYAIGKPAREVLFTVVPRADKYKAKSCIDTFVYRGGDALGAWVYEGLKLLGGAAAAMLSVIPLAIAWAVMGLWLGRRQRRLAEQAAIPVVR